MPLFECGGSTLLQNKQAIAKPSADTVYKASDDGYDGYEQVTVPKFATLGTKSITANGTQSVISGNNSYSAVNVNVNTSVGGNYITVWSGNQVIMPWKANVDDNYLDLVPGNNSNVDGQGHNMNISSWSGYNYIWIRFQGPEAGHTKQTFDAWVQISSIATQCGYYVGQHSAVLDVNATSSNIHFHLNALGAGNDSRPLVQWIRAVK